LFVAAALLVAVTLLFAPRKPPAPPPSTISYEEKAKPAPQPEEEPLPSEASRPRRAKEKAPEPAPDAWVVTGTVTDAVSQTPLAQAYVSYRDPADKSSRRRRGEEAGDPKLAARRGGAEADKNGVYTLYVKEPGSYLVSVRCNGYVTETDHALDIAPEAKKTTLDFALGTGARISGKVTERGTSKPAKGVMVITARHGQSAHTNDDGVYSLSGLTPGEYVVTLNVSRSPYTIAKTAPTRNVTIQSSTQEVRGIDFTVEPGGKVWGYVNTLKKEAVTDSDVLLCSSDSIVRQAMDASMKQSPPPSGHTDDKGYYEIMSVPLNKEWHVFAMSKARAPQLSDSFILTQSQRVARIDLFLSDGTGVYGRVVSKDRKPVPEAEVVCIPSYTKFFSQLEGPQAFRPVNSEADGTFAILHMPPGEYQVLARKKGFKFAATGEPVYPDGIRDITDVEVVLTPVPAGAAGNVFGRVTTAQNAPVSGATVTLSNVGTEDLEPDNKDAQTDPQGKYLFESVSPGFMKIRVSKEGYQSKDVSKVALDEATDVTLDVSATVSGTVLVKETGDPATAFTVSALQADSAQAQPIGRMIGSASTSSTSGDGTFSLQLGPGEYILEARATGFTPGRTNVSVSSGQTGTSTTIYVSQHGGRIQGRVRVVDGHSPQGAYVSLNGGSGLAGDDAQKGVSIREDGAFEFHNLSPGTYNCYAKLEGYAQGQSGAISLSENQNRSGVEITLTLGNALEGTVAMNGRLEPGAVVTVVGGGVNEITSSDANGAYHIEKLAAGSYMVSAISFGSPSMGLPFSLVHARTDVIDGQTNICNLGEPTPTALYVMCTLPPPQGTIAYAVLYLLGAPAELLNMNMLAFGNMSGSAADIANYIMGLAPIGPDGVFRLENLVGGQYALEVVSSSINEALTGKINRLYSGPATVVEGQMTPMNVTLPPATGNK
jgi:hypothetical protein